MLGIFSGLLCGQCSFFVCSIACAETLNQNCIELNVGEVNILWVIRLEMTMAVPTSQINREKKMMENFTHHLCTVHSAHTQYYKFIYQNHKISLEVNGIIYIDIWAHFGFTNAVMCASVINNCRLLDAKWKSFLNELLQRKFIIHKMFTYAKKK